MFFLKHEVTRFAVMIFFIFFFFGTAACGGGTAATNTSGDTPEETPEAVPESPIDTPEQGNQIDEQSGFDTSANSITVSSGSSRSDPEGVAATVSSPSDITWKDSRNADRTITLYGYLYQYNFSFVGGTSDESEVTSRSANDAAWGHPGFGYVVSHNTQNSNSPLGKANIPSTASTTLFAGAHHSIHHIELNYSRGGGGGYSISIPVVIEWLVATGRDHPIWSVTWKMGSVSNPNSINLDSYLMDTRGPYGSLNFDGASTRETGDAIGGVAWGDVGYKFTTTDSPLLLNSTWTYNTPNAVNFTQAWTASTNSEMGIVQTRPDSQMGYQDRVAGRERGNTSADAFTDKGDCTDFSDNRSYTLPCISGWPYQLMNYDWDPSSGKSASDPTGTKLVAWGSPYGWLGASSFNLFDYSGMADGRGDRSYATFIVLGPKCRFSGGVCNQAGDVSLAIAQVEALVAATITNVTAGSLVTSIAKGPGATEMKSISNGYNDTYATFTLSVSSNQLGFIFTPAGGKSVKNPIFVIQNYTAGTLPKISVGGAAITVNTGAADSGAFVSLNTSTNELWVTLNRTFSSATSIQVGS